MTFQKDCTQCGGSGDHVASGACNICAGRGYTTRTYAVFYADREMFTQAHRSGMFDAGDVALPAREFGEHYGFMGTFEADSKEALFALLNNNRYTDGVREDNPLGHPVIQELVVARVGHTSMSVGDIAVDLADNKMWLCAGFGWSDLELV